MRDVLAWGHFEGLNLNSERKRPDQLRLVPAHAIKLPVAGKKKKIERKGQKEKDRKKKTERKRQKEKDKEKDRKKKIERKR